MRKLYNLDNYKKSLDKMLLNYYISTEEAELEDLKKSKKMIRRHIIEEPPPIHTI